MLVNIGERKERGPGAGAAGRGLPKCEIMYKAGMNNDSAVIHCGLDASDIGFSIQQNTSYVIRYTWWPIAENIGNSIGGIFIESFNRAIRSLRKIILDLLFLFCRLELLIE